MANNNPRIINSVNQSVEYLSKYDVFTTEMLEINEPE